MCGICGIFSFNSHVEPFRINQMAEVIKHRGPDDEGYLIANTRRAMYSERFGDRTIPFYKEKLQPISEADGPINLTLGHQRLSIIDLSEKGHQPMTGWGNWIIYNGEIYNYIELREDLRSRGYFFDSNTDTEVILASYKEWGIDCLNRFNGMWAFAIWDEEQKKIVCARDRFGIKPFYYSIDKDLFIFASEIKSILASGLIEPVANDHAIFDFLVYGMVDHLRETFFKNIIKLMPGEYCCVEGNGKIAITKWWQLQKKELFADPLEQFKDLFRESVRIRLRSDVQVGSCLSGGLDSSYVVCQMSTLVNSVNTFSAVYGKGVRGDESEYIDAAVKRVGAIQHTVIPKPDELESDIANLVYHQEEPFGSTSIYAQWKVMDLAQQKGVIVLLDGQGADEQLCGYHPYMGIYYAALLKNIRWISFAKEIWNYLSIHKNPKIIGYTGYYTLPKSIQRRIRATFVPLKTGFVRRYSDSCPIYPHPDFNEFLRSALENSLPQLLRYEDKNSMAFSRETRLPFLDYRLVEMIYSLPIEAKVHRAVTKKIMRKAMDGMVPEKIRNRLDKVGFETPQSEWFRNELQSRFTQHIHGRQFATRSYWDSEKVKAMYSKFIQGRGDCNILWRILSTELWLRKFISLN